MQMVLWARVAATTPIACRCENAAMISSPTASVESVITPDFGPRRRATVFFRPLLILPIVVLASLLSGNSLFSWDRNGDAMSAGSGLLLALVLIIVFTHSYPSWLLTFIHGLQSLELKIGTYALLLRDEYPSLHDREYAYVLYPDIDGGAKLNRGLPLVKWFLAIPHYIVLFATGIAVLAVTIVAWFAILFTGKYPQGLAPFAIGWLKYYNRVIGYAFALVTDEYPKFRLG